MKKLFTFLLLGYSGISNAQYFLGIRQLNQFPTNIVDGNAYQLGVYIVNRGALSFGGKVDIMMRVNATTPDIMLVHEFDVLQALGHSLPPGDSILWTLNGYIFPSASFHAGINDILVWPEAPNTNTSDKGSKKVNYMFSPVMRDNRGMSQMAVQSRSCHKTCGAQLTYEVVAENPGTLSLDLYPNPATNSITVAPGMEGTISLLSVSGQVLAQYNSSASFKNVDISTLQSGYYLVKFVSAEGDEITRTFVKQ